MFIQRKPFVSHHRSNILLFRTCNVLCSIQDGYHRKKSHCQVEWNISREIYTSSEFSSTSYGCLADLRMHKEWGKTWRNSNSSKMIYVYIESKHILPLTFNITFTMYHQAKYGCIIRILQNRIDYSGYGVDWNSVFC